MSEPPQVAFEEAGDTVHVLFKLSRAQFLALETHGREAARAANVLYPLPPWSDELCARWAVQHAISHAYPEIANAPRVGETD